MTENAGLPACPLCAKIAGAARPSPSPFDAFRPVVPAPMTTLMTPAEFVIWLRGYLAAATQDPVVVTGDLALIAKKLDGVSGAK